MKVQKEKVGLPRGGKGVVSDDEPLMLNCAAGYRLWDDTDLVIGIG